MGVKDNIEHIDTNILIRLITKDNPKQLKKIVKLLSQEDKLFVFEDAAMMEVVYVLSGTVYNFSREQICRNIMAVMEIQNIVFNKTIIRDALEIYASHPKLSFVDCYLAIVTDTSREVPLWTLDRKLASQCPVARAL